MVKSGVWAIRQAVAGLALQVRHSRILFPSTAYQPVTCSYASVATFSVL